MTTLATANRPALLTAILGVCCLAAGAVWPWFVDPGDPIGEPPAPWLLWLGVAAGAVVLIGILLRGHPLWLLGAAAVTVAAALAARAGADASWMCVDGVDGDGNPVGFCAEDEWSFAPYVYAAGVVLTVAGALISSIASRRRA